MNFIPMEWDSTFFNLKIAKIEASMLSISDIKSISKLKKKRNFDLIYIFLDQPIERSKSLNIEAIDRKVTYQKEIKNNSVIPLTNIFEYNEELTQELIDLAILSGHQSRFKKDPLLSPKFEELYHTWIKKSLIGDLADNVFISKENRNITGFVTVKGQNEFGQIGLIAVSPDFQRKGIGRKLLQAVDNWYMKMRIRTCEVVTQLDNSGACLLYERNNYSVKSIKYIYHL